MALSPIGRKALLPHGSQRKIARQLGVEESRVSNVIGGGPLPRTEAGWKSWNRIQRAVAKAIALSVEEAFGAEERGVEEPAGAAA